MKLTKDFFKITNVLAVGAFCMLKWCMPSHQNLHTSKIIHTAEKERGREGEAVTVAFFCKNETLRRKPVMSPTR